MSAIKEAGIQLIGIHGYAGAGNDTIALYIHEWYRKCWVESFAAPLKAACSNAFGIPLNEFSDPETKNESNAYWGVSPSQIAQFIDTEIFRDAIIGLLPEGLDEGFWINRLEGKLLGQLIQEEYGEYGEYGEGDTVIVPDVRFQDEADWIVENGGIIIHVRRDGAIGNVGIKDHRSEAGNLNTPMEVTSLVNNNSTPASLYQQVELILAQSHLKLTRSE